MSLDLKFLNQTVGEYCWIGQKSHLSSQKTYNQVDSAGRVTLFPATIFRYIEGPKNILQSGPQPEPDIWWRHPNFQHDAQTKGHDPGSLFSSLLRLEMTFSHSELRLWMMRKHMSVKKMAADEVCVFPRGKTAENGSVSAQRSTWQGPKHLKIERCVSFLWYLQKIFLKST